MNRKSFNLKHVFVVLIVSVTFNLFLNLNSQAETVLKLPKFITKPTSPYIEIPQYELKIKIGASVSTFTFSTFDELRASFFLIQKNNPGLQIDPEKNVETLKLLPVLKFYDGRGQLKKSISLSREKLDPEDGKEKWKEMRATVSVDKSRVLILQITSTLLGDEDQQDTGRYGVYDTGGNVIWEKQLPTGFAAYNGVISEDGVYVTVLEERSSGYDGPGGRSSRLVGYKNGEIILDTLEDKDIEISSPLQSSPSGIYVAACGNRSGNEVGVFFDLKRRQKCFSSVFVNPLSITNTGVADISQNHDASNLVRFDVSSCVE